MKHEVCRRLIKAIDAYIAKQDEDIADDLKEAGYEDTDWTKERMQDLEDNLAAAMNVDTQIVAEQLEKSNNLDDFINRTWEVYQEASALADDIQEIVEEGLAKTLPRLVADYLQQFDSGLVATVLRARTVGWAAAWSEELAEIMKLNSHQKIGSILLDALTNGKSVAQATQDIMDSGIRDSYARARQTALTEMLTAHSVAAEEAIQQCPAVEDKEWRHTGSRRNKPRKNHVAMDGQIVPKDQPFELEGADGGLYKPMYPRDTILPAGERINCHCIHRGIASADVLGLPLAERKKLQQAAIDADDQKWAVEMDERNKAKAGLSTFGAPINSLLPNANGGILKPDKTIRSHNVPRTGTPNSVIDYVMRKGGISRTLYDDQGRVLVVIDNNDHGYPHEHPYGNGGAHYVRWTYDEDGNGHRGVDRCLTSKMRRLCRDIITEYPDMILKEDATMVDMPDLIDAIDNSAAEVFIHHGDDLFVISQSLGKGPNGEPITILTPDETHYAQTSDGVLDVTVNGSTIRSLLHEMEWG